MKKGIIGILFVFVVLFSFISAAEVSHDVIFEQAKGIINQNIVCSELSDDQFEMIGEYYMELMMPGELHEIADVRMGGEGSESLRLAHVNIARMRYCGEFSGMSGVGYGMMGGMGFGMYGDNVEVDSMYGRGMYRENIQTNFMYNQRSGMGAFWWPFYILIVIGLILIVAYLRKKGGEKKLIN